MGRINHTAHVCAHNNQTTVLSVRLCDHAPCRREMQEWDLWSGLDIMQWTCFVIIDKAASDLVLCNCTAIPLKVVI